MVKFVESDTLGLPIKRKQVAQACAKCRRRKKRCVHGSPPDHGGGFALPESPNRKTRDSRFGPPTQVPSSNQPADTPLESLPTPGVSSNPGGHISRFVGDLNPEAIFMEATSLCARRDISAPGGYGTWQSHTAHEDKPAGSPSSNLSSQQTVQGILRSYLCRHGLPCCPPAADFAVLRRIYIEKLDPIFPILSSELGTPPQDEASRVVLQQVISLAASADPEATQHLRLSEKGGLLSRQEFCSSLSNSIQISTDAGIITDRILLTRILTALSLYMQPTSCEDADAPALLNSRAVHQMHTLGFQMEPNEGTEKCQMMRSLFCCVWALDRINAAFYGRACLIHERDVGWNMEDCIRRQPPPFRLLLMLTRLLERVISLYRPTNKHGRDVLIELPIFEQMILDADASRLSNSCLASLEIFYHSVAILSSQSPAEVASTALPAPATNSRRSLSADRIYSIVAEECLGQLAYMPTIPYGVSLALSVSYRKMRHSKVAMFRNRGKQAFRANTLLLKSLGDTFWTARTMVAMAEQVLQEMDKAVASLAQETGLTDSPKKADTASQGECPTPQTAASDIPVDNKMQGNTNWALQEAAPDLDVFGYFDPTFDLDAVDAALEGNLDFGASSNWFDWQQHWG
ncbi:hypothetical protein F5X96DRAFT_403194 [Biscogniauxia mediterranea]|nr:hypothetical protein F5X96DRAFT_403194 [Biscogniauxia mediterranea]